LAIGCDSPTVTERLLRDVYDFRLLAPVPKAPDPKVMRWPAGTTVRLYIAPDADITHASWLKDAVAHGVIAWNSALLYGEVKLEVTTSPEDADVIVQYSGSPAIVQTGDCQPSGSQAYTTFCLDDNVEHLDTFEFIATIPSHVKFLVTLRSTEATDAANVRRLLTHELGHVLGIGRHSPKQTDLMFGGTLIRDVPSPSDRATLQVLYHTVAEITP
jgi:predicted Zn-dependent protease